MEPVSNKKVPFHAHYDSLRRALRILLRRSSNTMLAMYSAKKPRKERLNLGSSTENVNFMRLVYVPTMTVRYYAQ